MGNYDTLLQNLVIALGAYIKDNIMKNRNVRAIGAVDGDDLRDLEFSDLVKINNAYDPALDAVMGLMEQARGVYDRIKEVGGPIRQELALRYLKGIGVVGAPPPRANY